MTQTIAQRAAQAGYTRGFDYLRIGLAILVVSWHGVYISGDEDVKNGVLYGPLGPFRALILPMFFALSGFLVAGSLERNRTIEGFLTLRVLRLMPALAVEVLLSALILGPILTTVPLSDYFVDSKVRIYLLNIIGWIHYELPGVFLSNPRPDKVNLSLWTVPFELECYLSLTLISVFGVFVRRRLMLVVIIGLIVLAWAGYFLRYGGIPINTITLPGRVLVLGFLAGMLISVYSDRIPFTPIMGLVSLVASVLLIGERSTMVLSVLPAAYLTVWLGMLNPPKIPVLMDGDYSYGVYLFAYPIQQTIALVPSLRPWYIALPIALAISFLYAAFSWHCIEKRLLGKKKVAVQWVEAHGAKLRGRFGFLHDFGLISPPSVRLAGTAVTKGATPTIEVMR